MNYCPLNIRTGYTFLSSSLKVDDVFNICDKFGYPYFGICDLNSMFSFGDLNKYHSKFSTNYILGATFNYYINQNTLIKISAFIENEIGYKNLCKIISNYPQGIDAKELSNLKNGLLIVIPTITNTEIDHLLSNKLLSNFTREFEILTNGFQDAYFGIEIYQQSDKEKAQYLREFVSKFNYKTIAFNLHLYTEKNNAIALQILSAIKEDKKLNIKECEGPYFFLKAEVINSLYTEEEIQATFTLSQKCCNFNLIKKRGKLLSFSDSNNKKELIYKKCINSLKNKGLYNETYINRVIYELNVIEKLGYIDYFLLVEDYVKYAKNNKIPVGPGRGSAAGSLVSYLLNITEIDSIKYDLLFERFLNPKRSTMPDIDIDFADYRRDDVCNYIMNKYGKEHTANIITFQTFGARASLRDIGRVFGYDNRYINSLTSAVGKASTLNEAYKTSATFRNLCKDQFYLEIVKLAKKIEGLPRQSGIHAAGLIINDEEIINSCPIIRNSDGNLLTQFEAPLLNDLGFLKMDLLGLTNLTILESMEKYVKQYFNPNFSISNISFDDKKTFDVLNRGLTCGIFQIESFGITKTLKEVRIDSFDDIVAVLALYRPGPMDNIPIYAQNKNNNKEIIYIHPLLKPILSSTFGVIIYQEQIMQIAQSIAGFDLGKADIFRRAISKKDVTKMKELKDDFINGALKNNLTNEEANKIYDLIFKFADYGFNKSHSVSYAVITYQMSYIKANYPAAFYASMLNYLQLNDPKVTSIKKELSFYHIKLLLPSIQKSKDQFVITKENNLLLPFSNIKGINRQIVSTLLKIQKNDISDFPRFMSVANEYNLNEQTIVNLINSGCLDEYNKTRTTLRKAMPIYNEYYRNISLEGNLTRDELLEFSPIISDEPENERLKYDLEYQSLNILLSGSIMKKHQQTLHKLSINNIYDSQQNKNTFCRIAGIITQIKKINTKKKEQMAIINVQDDSAEIEVVIFPRLYNETSLILEENKTIIIKGSFKENEDNLSFIAEAITLLED